MTPSSPNSPPTLDERKFEQDIAAKKRELDLKEREIAAKERELNRTRWSSPLLIAVLAAIAGVTGSAVTYLNNNHNLQLEKARAQSTILLEAIKTGNPDQACRNLLFFISAGLIDDPTGTIRKTCDYDRIPPNLPLNPHH